MKKNKHHFYSDKVKKLIVFLLKFPHAVSHSFLSVFPHLSVETMATSRKLCHLTGEMLNLTAKAGDRARI
jgi:hypothetical protein